MVLPLWQMVTLFALGALVVVVLVVVLVVVVGAAVVVVVGAAVVVVVGASVVVVVGACVVVVVGAAVVVVVVVGAAVVVVTTAAAKRAGTSELSAVATNSFSARRRLKLPLTKPRASSSKSGRPLVGSSDTNLSFLLWPCLASVFFPRTLGRFLAIDHEMPVVSLPQRKLSCKIQS
jgi:hypothetical protein